MKILLAAALAVTSLFSPFSAQAASFKPLWNFPEAVLLEGVIEIGDAERLPVATPSSAKADLVPVMDVPVIVDGDTIAVGHERIRLIGIDTPESFRSRCEAELVHALEAKQRLRELLRAGPVEIERNGQDRYGRTLARVRAGGVDVAAVLLAEGFALPYVPGKAAKDARLHIWCGPHAHVEPRPQN